MLTDKEFRQLMDLRKFFDSPKRVLLPKNNEKSRYNVLSEDPTETFIVDYDRSGSFELRHKTQLRHHQKNVLVRIEVNRSPHMNPNGEILGRNHIHIYREGESDRWAYDLKSICPDFHEHMNVVELFQLFCAYCNIEIASIHLQGVL